MSGYRSFEEVSCFEDYRVGDRFRTADAVEFSEEGIVAFARQYDPQRFHIDKAAAEASPFGGIVAAGVHTLSACWGHMIGSGFLGDHALGAPGMKEVNWYLPVRPGDRVRVEAEVLDTRRSKSRRDRGFVTFRVSMINQKDETVMDFVVPQILLCRD